MRGSNHMNVNIVNVPMLKWVICIVMLEKHIMLNPLKFEVKKDVKINMKCDTWFKEKVVVYLFSDEVSVVHNIKNIARYAHLYY